MRLNIAVGRVLRVTVVAQEHGGVAVLAPHAIEQACDLLRLLFGALVDGHAHVAFGQLIQCLTCGNAFRIVQGTRGGSRQVVGGIVHAQARVNTPLTAPGEGRMFAHRHRTGGAQHALQNLRVLGVEHRAQGLAGHIHRHTRMLGGTHRSGAFVEQPAVAGIEVAAAGDHERVHGGDSVRELHHALNGLRQRMQHLRQRLHLRQRHQLGNGGSLPVGVQLRQDALERREGQLAFSRRPWEEEKRQVLVGCARLMLCRLMIHRRANIARRMVHIAGHEGDRRAAFGKRLSARNSHGFVAYVVGVLADIANDEHARCFSNGQCCRRMVVLCHGYTLF